MIKSVYELRLLTPLLHGPPAQVHVDLHLATVNVAGDDVRSERPGPAPQTLLHCCSDDVSPRVSPVVDERPVLCALSGGDDVAGVGAEQVSPLRPGERE